MKTVLDVDQLSRDTDPVALVIPAHTSFQDGGDIQLAADQTQVVVLAFESKRRSAPGNPQFLDLGKHIEQFLCQAIREILVTAIFTHIHKRQNGDGLEFIGRCGRCFFSNRGLIRALRLCEEFVINEKTEGQYQQDNNGMIQFLTGDMGNGLATVNIFFLFDAIGCHLESPGKKQRNRQTDGYHQNNHTPDDLRQVQ